MAALLDPEKLIPLIIQIVLAGVALWYTIETRRLRIQNQQSLDAVQAQIALAKAEVRHTSAFDMINLSNQHNWYLLDHNDDMPNALPHWIGLTKKGWAWRILHLNHLNLLTLARDDYKNGLIDDAGFDGWIQKGRFWFRNLSESTSDFEEGRQRMKELMQPEEGYSKEFREWLVNSQIIPKELVFGK